MTASWNNVGVGTVPEPESAQWVAAITSWSAAYWSKGPGLSDFSFKTSWSSARTWPPFLLLSRVQQKRSLFLERATPPYLETAFCGRGGAGP